MANKKQFKKEDKPMTKAEKKTFQEELLAQMTKLSTSGFGLVAALAWNSAIQDFFEEYINRWFPSSGLAYKFLYALIITFLIVLFTYHLSKISARFQSKKD